MIINHNVSALNTYRQLGINAGNGAKSTEKLSSGLRINRAGDDAAGLAISEKMRAQIRGLDQASRNSQDGISMIQTTEGALAETHSILQRMRELAVQAANDTNVNVDREELQKEMNQLTSEVNRIGNTTEFNTQALLKGKDAKVVATVAANNTIKQGVTGVPQGELSALLTNKNSVVGVSSSTTIQASRSEATGAVSKVTEVDASVKGLKSTVTINNGITFESAAAGDALNGKTIEVKQGDAATSSLVIDAVTGNYTFTIGKNGDGTSRASNRGELYNELKYAIDNATFAPGQEIKVLVPSNTQESTNGNIETASPAALTGGRNEAPGKYEFEITSLFKEAGDTIKIGGKTFTAVIGTPNNANGEFAIGATAKDIVDGTATLETQATALKAAIDADKDLSARFTVGLNVGTGKLTLTEKAGAATGVALGNPIVAGAGADDKLVITDNGGHNLKTVTIKQAATLAGANATGNSGGTDYVSISAGSTGTALNGVTVKFNVTNNAGAAALTTQWDAETNTLVVSGSIDNTATATNKTAIETAIKTGLTNVGFDSTLATVTLGQGGAGDYNTATLNGKSVTLGGGQTAIASGDTMTVDQENGNITIYLADTTVTKNTAAKIEEAIHALGSFKDGVDFTKFQVKAEGNWDTKTLGNSITKGTGTLVGGTVAVKGDYSFNINKAFAAGDTVVINGQTFTAVEKDAVASKGEFNIAGGNISSQAAGLIDAINQNAAFKGKYTASTSGNTISIVETAASGKDLKASDMAVKATGIKGEYSIGFNELAKDGAAFVIDGTEIKVSSKETHVGYADGSVIKEAATVADQTKALAEAINKNAALKDKYTASVNDAGELILSQKIGSSTDPSVQTKNSPKGDFTATFQVGANSGQSMTIEVKDMRANALGISGDGSNATVAAKNGKVASYSAIANVNSGSDNKNVEFALDITSAEKASAAISVINDAIEQVSSQRSNLGAFQNRLEHTINNLNTSSENLTAAESRIRDADMAKTVMENTKNSILQQAAQAMLAQANQAPQQVLQLLR